ncbi:MAG: BCD family MFS transporter [Burkholderiaceae bacterium]|nr:BCD family MFS transporter [Burkholderiaceae bacterium]
MSKMAALKSWRKWTRVSPRFLPFADVATKELPLGRLFQLSLFQVSVGMCMALLIGTLNRVMIVELGVGAWLVALMVALPLLFAPFRALVGFKSDTHRSVLGWRRVPYIWLGTLFQFSGLSIMPFALILLSGDSNWPAWIAHAATGLAILLVGIGLQTTQTAGLALATDIAPADSRPRVVAMMYAMLLVGMVASGIAFGVLLAEFSQLKLIKVIQGAAAVSAILNIVALWKQEARNPQRTSTAIERPAFRDAWRGFAEQPRTMRFFLALGMGTAAFSMQDVILEPYGGEVLGLSVSATTVLTALMATGALAAFVLAARWLSRGANAYRLSALGAVLGLAAFSCVIFSEPFGQPNLFRLGAVLIGFGGGLFSVGTLTAAMNFESDDPTHHFGTSGMVLGAWGAVSATANGLSIALGGALRDMVSSMALEGKIGSVLVSASTGYTVVYQVELFLLLATLIVIGPMVRVPKRAAQDSSPSASKFGLAEFPG